MNKQERSKALSEGQKRKWASGTRKPNPAGYGGKISAKLIQAHREGRMHVITHEAAMKGLANRDINNIIAANIKSGKKRRGVEMATPLSGKTEWHHKAKYWVFQNKELRILIQGFNLNKAIRDNSEHFDEGDLNWINYKCKATRGIRSLFTIDKRTDQPSSLSWRGWTAVGLFDREDVPDA
jgi:hypothetical protein